MYSQGVKQVAIAGVYRLFYRYIIVGTSELSGLVRSSGFPSHKPLGSRLCCQPGGPFGLAWELMAGL